MTSRLRLRLSEWLITTAYVSRVLVMSETLVVVVKAGICRAKPILHASKRNIDSVRDSYLQKYIILVAD